MISILVDEAYAFDILSILSIKQNNSTIDFNNYCRLCDLITLQIGSDKFNTIFDSEEYFYLIDANQLIYDLIEEIRAGKQISAEIIDDLNILRYGYKRRIQEKYFNTELMEKKTNE